MIPIPQEYIVQELYRCVSHITFNKHSNVYNGSCPFCREGKSWGKKTRFFFLPEKDLAYCHNCGYSAKPLKLITDLTSKSFAEVIAEVKKGEFDIVEDIKVDVEMDFTPATLSLPEDCINLSDATQLDYHKGNAIVSICMQTIAKRRLMQAVNKPPTFYLSLTDFIHKNRLILPFYDTFGDIIYYQSRTLLPADLISKPKYLCKKNSERCLSGIGTIDTSFDTIFLFEGPIDSYFVKNGMAVCGITDESDHLLTPLQQQQLNNFPGFNQVWCFDNQWNDAAALKKSLIISDTDKKIFIWPEELRTIKDLNDYCILNNCNGIDPDFILKNTFSGLKAKIMLMKIKSTCT